MAGFCYLASPYSNPDPLVRQQRFEAVCRAAAKLMLVGEVVFSPIAHSHSVETIGFETIKDGAFWKKQDIPMLRHAAKLAVLMLPGWRESPGVAWEIETANYLLIPVEFVEP